MKDKYNDEFSSKRDIEKNILEIINNIEKTDRKKLSLRKSKLDGNDGYITNTIKLLVQLFNDSPMSVKEKVDTILEYSDEYEFDTLLYELGISFLEFNSVISGNTESETLIEIDRKLTKILSSITETIDSNIDESLNKKQEEKEVCLRNSKLDAEADEFAEKLYRRVYGEKN